MKKRKPFLSLLLSILAISSLFPITLLASDKTLPSNLPYNEIEQSIDLFVKEHQNTTAAVSISIFDSNTTLFEKAYGMIDIENNIKANDDTVYEWGSITKMLTWVSVMQLVEKGKLNLDADIKNYLPKNYLTKLTYSTPITVKHLMSHNAGWQEVPIDINLANASRMKPLGKALKDLEPVQIYEPGEITAYSNWGTGLAGLIVEQISGMDFYEYVNANIFQPLNMKHTSVHPTLDDNAWVKNKRLSEKGYTTDLKKIDPNLFYPAFYPCGMAMGSIYDLHTFAQAFLSNPNPLFEKQETLTQMLQPTSLYATGYPENAHGLWISNLDGTLLGHDGNMAAFSSSLLLDIKNKIGVVVMVNQSSEKDYLHGIPALIFQKDTDNATRNSYHFATYYEMARTDTKGYSKIGRLPRTFKVTGITTNNLELSCLAVGTINLTRIGDRVFDYLGMASHLSVDETNYVSQIQISSTYMLERDRTQVYLDYTVCILAFLAFFYSFMFLIIKMIKLIALFKKPNNKKGSVFEYINLSINAINIIFFISLGLFCINLLSGTGTFQGILPHILLCFIYLGILIIYPLIFIFTKKNRPNKIQKLLSFLTGLSLFFISIFIIYWQQYCWWI